MKDEFNIYGKRPTKEECDERRKAISKKYSNINSEKEYVKYVKEDIDIDIDERLGEKFPENRREDMVKSRIRLEKKLEKLYEATKDDADAGFDGDGSEMVSLFQLSINEYSTALNDKELVHYFGGENDRDLVEVLLRNKNTPKI